MPSKITLTHRLAEGHWRPSLLARVFGRVNDGSLLLIDGKIVIVSGPATCTVPALQHEFVKVKRFAFWWQVSAPNAVRVQGLSSKSIRQYLRAIEHLVAEHDAWLAHTKIMRWWSEVQESLNGAWSERRWFTEEMTKDWDHRRVAALLPPLSKPARDALIKRIDRVVWSAVCSSTWVRERAVTQNEALVETQLRDEREFFDSIEKTPLTDEQARAVICFDNRTLLVASAGSGKTSTIVAKAGWTIQRGIAHPEEILLLAFNKAAAEEMAKRLAVRLFSAGIPHEGVRTQTFHSFGLRVIGAATGKKPRLAAGLDDDNGMGVLAEVVTELKATSNEFARKWWIMQNVLGIPIDSEEEAEPDSYDRTLGRGFRTLDGTVVKSWGERAIMNWLLQCGIAVRYEHPYAVDVADAEHSQYRPDFYYPQADLWHEHWAFVDGQRVPPKFAGYLETRAWKKALHRQHRTELIETSASQLTDGTLFDSLDAQLRAHGIVPDFDPRRPIKGAVPLLTDRELLNVVRTFLTHVKSNGLDEAALRSRVGRGLVGLANWRETTFLDLYCPVRAEWDRRLRAAGEVDFEDMLNQAAEALESDRWQSPYRVVLVDEFQDVSHARARMINALVSKPGRHLFAVGDDWQSIYRFAGSDITAMTRFQETFGRGHVLKLERTFRNSQQLATIAGKFVMRNPAQLRKTVRSAMSNRAPLSLVRVAASPTREARCDAVTSVILGRLDAIRSMLAPAGSASVMVLGRYRNDARLVPKCPHDRLSVSFRTIHAAKGLEADHVIVIGLDRDGFPCVKEDDPVLRLAMGDADPFRFAEERRLLYVAMTRARSSVLLIARQGRESEFITELIQQGAFGLVATAERDPANEVVCEKCGKGLMVRRTGRFGPFLGCSRFPACDAVIQIDTLPSRPHPRRIRRR